MTINSWKLCYMMVSWALSLIFLFGVIIFSSSILPSTYVFCALFAVAQICFSMFYIGGKTKEQEAEAYIKRNWVKVEDSIKRLEEFVQLASYLSKNDTDTIIEEYVKTHFGNEEKANDSE